MIMKNYLLILLNFVPFILQAGQKPHPPGPPPPPGLPIDQYQIILFLVGFILLLVYRKKLNKTT